MLAIYSREAFDAENLKTVCIIVTAYLEEKCGMRADGKTQRLDGNTTIYSKDYFCPKDSLTGKAKITTNTYSIHHYRGSWTEPDSEWFILKARCKRFVKRLVGKKFYATTREFFGVR